jgi:recombination protein RecA
MTKATEAAMATIKKNYGDDAVMRMGDKVAMNIPVISTGVLGIDLAIGVGGIPRGRITEIFGPPTSGKTTLALHVISEAQKAGLSCAYVDAEQALDVHYMNALGVNVDDVFISQPSSGEEGLSIAELWMMSGDIGIVVVDSVDALIPQALIDADFGASRPGLQAQMMSQGMRKLSAMVRKSNTALVFINQIRKAVMQTYGNPEYTTGGTALIYYSSVRMDVRKTTALKDGNEVHYGNRTKVKVVKNKVSIPFREVEFDLVFGKGADKIADLLDLAITNNVIDRSGSWYSLSSDNTKLGQGRQAALATLSENTEMLDSIRASILKAKGL